MLQGKKTKNFFEIVEMDGSFHLWFGDTKRTLLLAIDKCTNTILGGYFDKNGIGAIINSSRGIIAAYLNNTSMHFSDAAREAVINRAKDLQGVIN